eukprot:COSAG02_NODE_2077_length_9916_cov_9.422489_2_plen_601_part_00
MCVARFVLCHKGPCAGKTTALSALRTRLTDLGLHVVTVPENATMVFGNSGGYWPGWAENRQYHRELQKTLLLLQMDLETRMSAIAELHARSKDVQVVLLCDRGVLDGRAFCESDEEWNTIISAAGTTDSAILERYDLIFHLVTAANGAAEHYEYGATSRNPSRFHNPDQAIEADEKGRTAWSKHPHLAVIDNSTSFDQKVTRVLRRICHRLHLPLPSHAPLWRHQLRGPVPDSAFPAGVKVSTTHRTVHSLEDDTFALRVIKHDRGSGQVSYTRMDRKAEGTLIRNELANERQYDALVRESGRKVTQTVVRSFVWEGRYMELNAYPQRTTRQGADMSLDIEPWDGEINGHQKEEANGKDHPLQSSQSAVAINLGSESCGTTRPRSQHQLSVPHFLKPFIVSTTSGQSCDQGSLSSMAGLKRSAEPDSTSCGSRMDVDATDRPTKSSRTALVQRDGGKTERPPFLKRSLTHLAAEELPARPLAAAMSDRGKGGVRCKLKNSAEHGEEEQVKQDGEESEEELNLPLTAFTQEAAESDSENGDTGREEGVPSPSLSYAQHHTRLPTKPVGASPSMRTYSSHSHLAGIHDFCVDHYCFFDVAQR